MSSALSVGWLDIVLENGLVEAVAVLISKMPRLCHESTNGKLGELFKSKPGFIKVKFAIQYMQRAIQKLLGCTEKNPEERKGCCLIVLFSYLYFG
ncbi:nuclear pore complex protein NUP85-like [Arachis ipaensis]|uniref:nuclear pore complex protein NUP85-like n=1 Tax=Arachis ipaensis TaxID=130454 RepID=UPI000A2B744C|nr:nuclear pore complex protein NUP85-like [Arachis ipaensis]